MPANYCFLFLAALLLAGPAAAQERPNVIVILTDDLGYGDLGGYGSTRARTPRLDRMAAEGLKLTSFYAMPSCSPSRAALLTGCYPPRVGIPDVVGPPGPAWTAAKQYGLHPAETTLAEALGAAGYATALAGKWHLGHFAATMPGRQGFDEFFGLPYSNDMIPVDGKPYADLPLLRGTDTLEVNPDQRELTRRYTDFALDFVRRHRDTTFFLYLAHSMPHVPLFTSAAFTDRSGQGVYADVIEEIDAATGELLDLLSELGLDERTLVVFTSDNGPWLTYGNHAGSAGPLREGKGTTWEGGVRVPFLVRWPGRVAAGTVSHAPASLIDLLPTVVALAGAPLPGREIDGRDLSRSLLEGKAPPASPYFYYRSGRVEAVRIGPWKLHRPHTYRYVEKVDNDGRGGRYGHRDTGRELYHLIDDPAERYDLAAAHPERVARLARLIAEEQAEMDAEKRPAYYPDRE